MSGGKFVFVSDTLLENEIYTLFGKKWVSETLRLTSVKNMKSWYCYRTHEILGWLSYTWNLGMAIVLRLFPLFGGKCLLMVDKVNYDRPYMDHIERNKRQYFCRKIATKVNYDRFLVNYDRPLVNYDRPLY